MDDIQKRTMLVDAGYDPDSYDVVHQSELTPTTAPTNSPASTALQAGERGFRRSIGSSILGGLGGALGVLGAPETGGLSLAIPALSALAGSYLGGKAQEAAEQKMMSPEDYAAYQNSSQQMQQEHPIASTVGSLATAPLSGFRPGLSVPLNAARGAGNIIAGIPFRSLQPIERAAIGNLGLSTGINTGVDIGSQLVNNGSVDPTQTALGIAGSLINNTPNVLGRRAYGFHALPATENVNPAEVNVYHNGESIDPNDFVKQQQQEAILNNAQNIPTADVINKVTGVSRPPFEPRLLNTLEASNQGGETQPLPEPVLNTKGIINQSTGVARPAIGGSNIPMSAQEVALQKAIQEQASNKRVEEYNKRIQEYNNARTEEALQNPNEIQDALQAGQIPQLNTGHENMPNKWLPSAEDTPLTPSELAANQYLPKEEQYQHAAPNNQLSNALTPNALKEATRHGVEVAATDKGLTDQEGNPVKGLQKYDSKGKPLAAVNKSEASPDTLYHEIGHNFIDQMEHSTNPADQALIARGKAITGLENLTELFGKRYQETVDAASTNPRFKDAFTRWMTDVESNFRNKFSSSSPEDISNLLARRARKGASLENDPALRDYAQRQNINRDQQRFQEGDKEFNEYPSDVERNSTQPPNGKDKASQDLFEGRNPNPFVRKIASVVDKIRFLGTTPPSRDITNYAADRINDLHTSETRLSAKYQEPLEEMYRRLKITPAEDNLISSYMWDRHHNGASDIELSPKLKEAVDTIRNGNKTLPDGFQGGLVSARVEQRDNGPKINGREAGFKENYYPNSLSEDARVTMTQKRNTPRAQEMQGEWLKHLEDQGLSLADAQKHINEYLDAVSGKIGLPEQSSAKFAALRKAEGLGLPKSLIEPSAKNTLERYYNRYAKDMAYYRSIENDPTMRSILNIPDENGSFISNPRVTNKGIDIDANNPLRGTRELSDAFNTFYRSKSDSEQFLAGANNVVKSAFMGPLTGVKNMLTSWVHDLPLIRVQDIPRLVTSIGNYKQAFEQSLMYGVNRRNISGIEFKDLRNDSIRSPINRIADKFNTIANVLNKLGGRSSIESSTRVIQFALGQDIAETYLKIPPGVNKTVDRFFKTFGPEFEEHRGQASIDPNVVNEMAARWVERNQGTYDARNLPAGALEGTLAPMLTLSRWNIEKFNTSYKDIYLPLVQHGDIMPLLKSTIAASLGGAAIRYMAEKINNKITDIPKLDEAAARKSWGGAAYSLANSMNLAGYFGIGSTLMQSAFDEAHGKTADGFFNFPALDFMGNAIGGNIGNLTVALENGNDIVPTMTRFLDKTMYDSMQMYRIVANHTLKSEQMALSNKERDLRNFRELEGGQIQNESPGGSNPLDNYSGKRLGQVSSINDAKPFIQGAVDRAVTSAGGDVLKAFDNLKNLGHSSNEIVPSTKDGTGALEFNRYRSYIIQTHGPEYWNGLVKDFMTREYVNQPQKQALVYKYLADNPGTFSELMKKGISRRPSGYPVY